VDSNSTNQSKQPLPQERQLVSEAKAGDSKAFGILYDAYVERIYRFVFFRVADEQTAEDITAQVFLRAWEKLGRYRIGNSPFLAWLYTIARNAVIDHYRTRKTVVSLEEALPFLESLRRTIETSVFTVRSRFRPPEKPKKRRASLRRKKVFVTVSIGVAKPTPDRPAPEEVLRAADAALYRAKKTGRNRLVT